MTGIDTKTCADCNAINEATDLFCKSCGASLAMVSSTSDQTSAFKPVSPISSETGTMAIVPIQDNAALQTYPAYTGAYEPVFESPRGAVLGWIAGTLMLMVLGAFLWATIFSDSTRDSVLGIF